MTSQARITVPLSVDEFDALVKSAQSDYRHPRDQARHILRSALLTERGVTIMRHADGRSEGDAVVVEAASATPH